MLKKLILVLLVALPFTSFAQKFGTVDIEAIFTEMPAAKAMQAQLAEASKKYEDEFSKLAEELDKLYKDYQTIQNDASVPESIKERRIQEIQERSNNVDRFRATAQQDLARQQEQLAAPIEQAINEAISAVGAEGGFTFIFPKQPGLILYQGNDVVDATALVKAKLKI